VPIGVRAALAMTISDMPSPLTMAVEVAPGRFLRPCLDHVRGAPSTDAI
jgi:hypothetical protein